MAFPEADFETTAQAFSDGNTSEGDKGLLVQFYTKAVQSKEKTVAEGRPIYDEKVYVRIMVPGDRDNIVDRPVQDSDLKRFNRAYSAFQQGRKEQYDGTPLEAWPGISRSQVEEMKFFNVHTVEALAEMSDSNAQKFAGIYDLKRRAQAFLAAADENKFAEQMQAELSKRDEQIEALKVEIENLRSHPEEDDD
jgi:hypothetical protein